MTDSNYRLVYMSRNRIRGDDDTVDREVQDILALSRHNNAAADVTGALMFNNGQFAQVLEGPHDAIQATFERIQCDLRHAEVSILTFDQIDERRFSKWSMGYVGHDTQALNRFADITRQSGFNPADLTGDYIYDLLQEHLFEAEEA